MHRGAGGAGCAGGEWQGTQERGHGSSCIVMGRYQGRPAPSEQRRLEGSQGSSSSLESAAS